MCSPSSRFGLRPPARYAEAGGKRSDWSVAHLSYTRAIALSPPSVAADLGPALAGIAMYVLMAAVLSLKPAGLFPARG